MKPSLRSKYRLGIARRNTLAGFVASLVVTLAGCIAVGILLSDGGTPRTPLTGIEELMTIAAFLLFTLLVAVVLIAVTRRGRLS